MGELGINLLSETTCRQGLTGTAQVLVSKTPMEVAFIQEASRIAYKDPDMHQT